MTTFLDLNATRVRWWRWFGVLGFVLVIGSGYFARPEQQLVIAPLNPAPTWQGITPGTTPQEEALDILGDPDEIAQRGSYWAYRYVKREELGWEEIEFWVQERAQGRVVVAIWRNFPYTPAEVAPLRGAELQTLNQLVETYGRPDTVTWSVWRWYRYVIWASHGVSAEVHAQERTASSEWDRAHLGSSMLFEPMSVEQFMATEWPWPRGPEWSPNNMYASDHQPDELPKDPYDWSTVPIVEAAHAP